MSASRSLHLRSGARGAPARVALPLVLAGIAALTTFSAPLPAQQPATPPGFASHTSFVETMQPLQVRCCLQWNAKEHLVAIGPRLFRTDDRRSVASRPVMDLGPGEDIAFLAPIAPGRVAVGTLRSGRIVVVDPDVGRVAAFAGVANGFDAVAIGGDLLVIANPLWPQGGAHSGVWLLGPGRTPREVLPLVGPSAPLALLANGDLVVGELGPVVPPPPGAARLLRIPANRIAAARAGATLSMADVSASGTGFAGMFDLAVDTQDRLHVSDPASSVVVHTAPGGLVPVGTTLDVGAGRFVLGLQFVGDGSAPFRGFQPPTAAPMLGVGTSDYGSSYDWRLLRAARPATTVSTGTSVAPGAFTVDVAGAPPLGLAVAFASPSGSAPESIVAIVDGTPLWFALPLPTTFFVSIAAVAANGTASLAMTNPGGTPGQVDLQVVAILPDGSGDLGSSPVLHLDLLP